jgi:hypothetical protein
MTSSSRSSVETLVLSIGGVVGQLELEGAHPALLEQLRAR